MHERNQREIRRGSVICVLPQIGKTVCLERSEGVIKIAVPTYGSESINGYVVQPIDTNAFSIGSLGETVDPNGSDDEVFERAKKHFKYRHLD